MHGCHTHTRLQPPCRVPLNPSVDAALPAPGSPAYRNVSDSLGHGTHCAGLAGAVGNNGLLVSGVAWNVSMHICRAAEGELFYTSAVIDCLQRCGDTPGVRVVSASFGEVPRRSLGAGCMPRPASPPAAAACAAPGPQSLQLMPAACLMQAGRAAETRPCLSGRPSPRWAPRAPWWWQPPATVSGRPVAQAGRQADGRMRAR